MDNIAQHCNVTIPLCGLLGSCRASWPCLIAREMDPGEYRASGPEESPMVPGFQLRLDLWVPVWPEMGLLLHLHGAQRRTAKSLCAPGPGP